MIFLEGGWLSLAGMHMLQRPLERRSEELLRVPASTLQDAVHNCSGPSGGIPLNNRQSKCPPWPLQILL
jgi:hypothetical protein